MDDRENLVRIDETKGIMRNEDGVIRDEAGNSIPTVLMYPEYVGADAEFIDILDQGFRRFLEGLDQDDLKSEYLLPTIIGNLLKEKAASVKVLETADKWFGVTYQEDKQTVIDAFHELVDKGVYRSPLYE